MASRLSPDVSNGTEKVYMKKVRRGVGNCPRDTSRTEATKQRVRNARSSNEAKFVGFVCVNYGKPLYH